jgi:hypothetical protein
MKCAFHTGLSDTISRKYTLAIAGVMMFVGAGIMSSAHFVWCANSVVWSDVKG